MVDLEWEKKQFEKRFPFLRIKWNEHNRVEKAKDKFDKTAREITDSTFITGCTWDGWRARAELDEK